MDVDYIQHGRKLRCFEGAEKCGYKAFYAMSVIANYDIDFKTLIKIFISHGLTIYDCAMYLPITILNPKIVIPSDYYELNNVHGKMLFTIKDYANGYTHDINVWKKYLTTTIIPAGQFSIVSEITNDFHDFCFIRFTRVENPLSKQFEKYANVVANPNGFQQPCIVKAVKQMNLIAKKIIASDNQEKIYRKIPFKELYGEWYILPNYLTYFRRFIKLGDLYRDFIMIPKEFCDSMTVWACGALDAYFCFLGPRSI